MLGKILLILLGAVLLALLVILLLPVRLRVSYEGGVLTAWGRYAWWRFSLYPGSRAEEKEKPPEEQKTKPDRKKKKEKSPLQKPNREQISYSLDVLPHVLLKALVRAGRRIRLTPLKLHVLVAGSDPADTAVLYGKLNGVLTAALPPLHRAVRIDDQDIRLFPDFVQERMDCIADVGVKFRLWDAFAIAICAVFGLLKWYIGYKKRAAKEEAAPRKQKKVTAEADSAA